MIFRLRALIEVLLSTVILHEEIVVVIVEPILRAEKCILISRLVTVVVTICIVNNYHICMEYSIVLVEKLAVVVVHLIVIRVVLVIVIALIIVVCVIL